MYLKSDRELFRRRGRFGWVLALVVLLILVSVSLLAYPRLVELADEMQFAVVATPTPMPTATPAAGFYVGRAEEASWDGAVASAIAAYQQALDLEPNQTELYLELARLLIFQGQPERALEMARQALTRQPGSARAWAMLGLTYNWLGMSGQAITYCRRAIELDPTLAEAYAYLAVAYIDAGQWSPANEAIATAWELDPTDVTVLRNRAYVLEGQGNYSGAIEGYREALAVNDRLVDLYLGIGRNAAALGNLTRAREAYEAAVEIDPEHSIAWNRLGLTELLVGDYPAARASLEHALRHNPRMGEAYGNLGTLYFHQRNYEDAIQAFSSAIRYGEARSRRRTVLFVITMEDIDRIGLEPRGTEVAHAKFVHPFQFDVPLRGQFETAGGQNDVQGQIKLDVMTGRYEASVIGITPAPSGKVYVGWFRQLFAPEGHLIRTEPMFAAPDGRLEISSETGVVKGPPIYSYTTYALTYYLLAECDRALPLIDIALRLNPVDETALRTRDFCR